MSPATRSDRERTTVTITNEEVRRTFDAFVAALTTGDYQTLQDLYDNGCLLIRPDGTVLEKKEILNDFRKHSVVLSGFETTLISLKTTGYRWHPDYGDTQYIHSRRPSARNDARTTDRRLREGGLYCGYHSLPINHAGHHKSCDTTMS